MPKFSVQRSIVIAAPVERVYQTVVDYQLWSTWSPWLCAEPDTKVTITGSPSEVGAIYRWEGEITGIGELEHKSLVPQKEIIDEIRFLSDFKSTAEVRFDFETQGSSTKVTWCLDGKMPWYLFFLCSMMDTFVGADYERGLKMLKEWMETGSILSKTDVQGIAPVGPLRMAGLRQSCSIPEIGSSMQTLYPQVVEAFTRNQLTPQKGIAVYHKFDMKKRRCEYTCGFIVDASASIPDSLSVWEIPAVEAVKVVHHGSYNHLGNAWSAAMMYTRAKKRKHGRQHPFELYSNSPEQVSEDQLETIIYVPVR